MHPIATIKSLVSTLAVCLALETAAYAQETDLQAPQGPVVLTITGKIEHANGPEGASFDIEMLRALPSKSFETGTIWTEGKSQFKGVPLSFLLERVGAKGDRLKAIALNDYAVEIPVSDGSTAQAIVAYEKDGQTMPVRDKGPLWIVFPFDSGPDLQTETVYSRSIWQLTRIEVGE